MAALGLFAESGEEELDSGGIAAMDGDMERSEA